MTVLSQARSRSATFAEIPEIFRHSLLEYYSLEQHLLSTFTSLPDSVVFTFLVTCISVLSFKKSDFNPGRLVSEIFL